MTTAKKFQDRLLESTKAAHHRSPLSAAVTGAFYAVPRHGFVRRYRTWRNDTWFDVTEQNLEEHLATLYADGPLIIHGEDADFEAVAGKTPVSTISQPTFVLKMLDMLELAPGQRVFELGAGTGWNAALIGHIVGATGRVVSVEIIPELIQSARASVAAVGLDHVEIVEGDGGDGHERHAPYDRAIFTAGSYDLPRAFYRQVKTGGMILFVLKNKGGADTLILFEKHEDHFRSRRSLMCGFVPLTGRFHIDSMEARPLDQLLAEARISPEPVDSTPFWWSGASDESFTWLVAGLRSFLAISEPGYEAIRLDKTITTFGILDRRSNALVVAHHDRLVCYGSTGPKYQLIALLKQWIDRGMPALSTLEVAAYPIDREIAPAAGEWLSRRNESQFVWSLPKPRDEPREPVSPRTGSSPR
jgi:protein-L-isoaspartate(D-aspartate) O-methyltransferase